ncbi:6-phosphogluconolactonase [Pontibacter ummariensis]|uniref:6-phosphogluconolactonase n=1 Tax=Pontibacter ummariensis TaxID=1610492 RepID=A0A239GQB9_9BACT|nr:6-phosphogluconolactonase [Pontibacter ummariensis]PRY11372.1 6-phosphogluconolactonase [Pontibacter ummariensis]SNS71022.1 6-phosphogluconolactonase [Pontibacter ummariensis]
MIKIFEDKAQLSKEAAALFVKTAQEAVEKNGRFTVALTGGSSPVQLYSLLAQQPFVEQVPWKQTFIFWGDERWVPLTDNLSNARMATETFLSKVPVPPEQVYPMWSENVEPEAFAQQYEKLLQQHFDQENPQFDLILLGMGDDGHTASLFPGTEVLHEASRWVQAYFLAPQSMYRVTLTAPLINQAKKIVFLTFGQNKADALYEVLEGERNPEKYPSQLIQPKNGEVLWFVDESAASRLKKSK